MSASRIAASRELATALFEGALRSPGLLHFSTRRGSVLHVGEGSIPDVA
jgi:hypothetical protein